MFKCADPSKSFIFIIEKRKHGLSFLLDPCLPNPCGPGDCEITTNILNGYICRCYDGSIQMSNCSIPKSKFCKHQFKFIESLSLDPCITMPCGPQGRCLPLTAAPKGYMCMCQVDGVSYTTIDTCPSKRLISKTCHRLSFLFQ
jgi:hypothetical protein